MEKKGSIARIEVLIHSLICGFHVVFCVYIDVRSHRDRSEGKEDMQEKGQMVDESSITVGFL